MKARIPPKFSKEQKAAIRDVVADELIKQTEEVMGRFFKLMCVQLNEEFGFGYSRLAKLITRIGDMSREHENDEVFWTHIDQRIQQIGLPFEPEDYEKMERKRRK